MESIKEFVESQPHKLKLNLSLGIYKKVYENIDFLKDKKDNFKAWICPLLKPILVR